MRFALDYINLTPGMGVAPSSAPAWTNLLLDTEDFTTGNWTATATYDTDIAGVAPDSGDAQRWECPITAGVKGLSQGYVGGAGNHVQSLLLRRAAGDTDTYVMRWNVLNATTPANNRFIKFNWVNGSDPVVSETGPGATGIVADDGDGWWRLSIVVTDDNEGDTMTAEYQLDRNQWQGYKLLPWGAQAESGVGLVAPSAYQARGGS